MSAPSHRGGYTVVELLIGLVVLCALFGSVALVQKSAMDSMSTSSNTGLLNEEAARAMNALAAEARWTESGSFLITDQQGWARLDFRVPVGYAGGPVWSSVITYAVVPSGSDSNGDGVFDEGNLVRAQVNCSRPADCIWLSAACLEPPAEAHFWGSRGPE